MPESASQRYNLAWLYRLFEVMDVDLNGCDRRAFRERLLTILIEPGTRVDGIQPDELSRLVIQFINAYVLSRSMSTSQLTADQDIWLREYLERLFRYANFVGSGRRFIRSSNDMLGFAPTLTRPLDVIAILHGSDVPIILRQNPELKLFKVVGQCYLEGIMNGEAMTWGEHEADEIILA